MNGMGNRLYDIQDTVFQNIYMEITIEAIRVFTGSGYEDFTTGEEVRGEHIFGIGKKISKIVKEIKITTNKDLPFIKIIFDDGYTFKYSHGFNFRIVTK